MYLNFFGVSNNRCLVVRDLSAREQARLHIAQRDGMARLGHAVNQVIAACSGPHVAQQVGEVRNQRRDGEEADDRDGEQNQLRNVRAHGTVQPRNITHFGTTYPSRCTHWHV